MSERSLKTCRSQISDICIMQRTGSLKKKRFTGKNEEWRELNIHPIVMHSTRPTDFWIFTLWHAHLIAYGRRRGWRTRKSRTRRSKLRWYIYFLPFVRAILEKYREKILRANTATWNFLYSINYSTQ